VIGTLLIAAVVVVAVGAVASATRRGFGTGLWTQAAGSAGIAGAGLWALLAGERAGQGFGPGLVAVAGGPDPAGSPLRFGVDGLSGLFLFALGLVAAAALVFSRGYLTAPGPDGRDRPDGRARAVAALTGVFVLVLVLVLCARDPVGFLTGWEAMSLVPAVVILVQRRADARSRRTVFTYLAITHLAGVGTWTAVLLAARTGVLGGSMAPPGRGVQVVIAVTALFGMGAKAGAMPLHVWLPRAHPIAPAPVSALMSGVMVKVAVYGMVRLLVVLLGPLPTWFGVLVLAVGGFSAVGGVTYALLQHELKRLLALSSIENVGIVLLGLGACLVLRAQGADAWAAVALGACLLHTLNHAVFKALLFLGAGAVERATGTLRLDHLGGLLRRMPRTGVAVAVAAAAIAGLPPLNGFASEWVTFQVLLRLPARHDLLGGVAGLLALAALAATAGLAVTCFVKVVGLVLLGPARSAGAAAAREVPASMTGPTALLAATCVVLGVVPGLLLRPLVALAPWLPDGAGAGSAGVTAAPLGAALHLPGSGGLPTPGLAAVLVALTAVLALARGRRSAAPAPSWACGQVVGPELNWTGAGFTKPLRLVLESVLRPRRHISVREEAGIVHEVTYRGHVPQLIDERVYRPAARRSAVAAAYARRLQSGSLGTYVGYLIGLVVLLLVLARTGVLA